MASQSVRHRPSFGERGTVAAYRRGCRCEACKAANTRQRRMERARKKQASSKPLLTIVPAPQVDTQPPTDADTTADVTERRRRRGDTEKAVEEDLDAIERELTERGLLFNTLRAAAIALAREIDSLSSTSKAPLVKQLLEVMSKLSGKDGDDDPLAFLEGLADEFPSAAGGDEAE